MMKFEYMDKVSQVTNYGLKKSSSYNSFYRLRSIVSRKTISFIFSVRYIICTSIVLEFLFKE